MNATTIKVSTELGSLAFMPTRLFIETLQVGDLAPNCFGKVGRVTSIAYRGVDAAGRPYVGYYVTFGEGGKVSHSLKAGAIDRTMALINQANSAEIDQLEATWHQEGGN